jgi:glc operon protein GlcG
VPLKLEEAQRVVQAAQEHARQAGLRVAAAVVDEGGTLLALARMDGAFPLSSRIAEAKAVGAALLHRDGDSLASLQSERPAFFDAVDGLVQDPIVPGLGSLVIRREGAVLGAVGVSGAKPEQDLECARAGMAALGI